MIVLLVFARSFQGFELFIHGFFSASLVGLQLAPRPSTSAPRPRGANAPGVREASPGGAEASGLWWLVFEEFLKPKSGKRLKNG